MLTDDGNSGKLPRRWLHRLVGDRTPAIGARGELTPRGRRNSAARLARVVAIMVALVASLLTFPNGVTWMLAAWLVVFTWCMLRGQRPIGFLLTPVVVLLVKRVDLPPASWLLFAVVLAVGAMLFVPGIAGQSHASWRRMAASSAICSAWLAFAFDCHRSVHCNHPVAPLDRRPIICIGDSLTAMGPRGGYPEVLASLVNVPVVNLGQPGITSAEALKLLPALRAARPQVVVVELGGHDFLKDASLLKTRSRAETKRILARLIAAAREAGAEVVLIEIPRAFISDPYAGLERELAREYDLELVPDTVIRQFVLYSPYAPPGMWTGGPYLSDDGLHPNARGSALFARYVARALTRLYGPNVLRNGSPP